MQNTVTGETRLSLWLVIVVIAAFGFALCFFPGSAGSYWVWEIGQPRTAFLIGAIYLAATFHYINLTRQTEWLLVHSTLYSLFLVAAWLLVAAMFHWDVFYPYRFFTVLWLAAYYLPLLAIPIVIRLQAERFPEDLAGVHVAPGWRTGLWLRAAVYAATAVLIFVFPTAVSRAWPWPIEPVNLRMFSGQIFVFGAYTVYALRDGLWRRLKMFMQFTALLAITHLLGLLLLGGGYDWSAPAGFLLPFMFVEWLATSLVLLRTYR